MLLAPGCGLGVSLLVRENMNRGLRADRRQVAPGIAGQASLAMFGPSRSASQPTSVRQATHDAVRDGHDINFGHDFHIR